MKIILTIILTFFTSNLLLSDQIADSLNNMIDKTESDTAKVSILLDLSSHIYFSDKYKALEITEKAFDIAENEGYKSGQLRALIEKAIVYRRMKAYDSAMIAIDNAVKLDKLYLLINEYSRLLIEKGRTLSAKKLYDSAYALFIENQTFSEENNYPHGIAESQLYIGKYFQHSNLDSSLKYLESSIYTFNALGKENKVVKAYNAYATTYAYKGNLQNAIINFKDALAINIRLNHTKEIADSYSNIALAFYYQSKPDSAIFFHLKSLKYYEKANNLQGVADKQNDIGILYREQGQLELALKYLKLSEEANEALGYKKGLANNRNNIANIYLDMEKFNEAKEYSLKALKIILEIKDEFAEANIYGNLGLIYFKLNNYSLALNYYNKAIKLNNKSTLRNKNLAKNYINIGELYQAKGDDISAMAFLIKAKNIADQLNRMDIKKHSLEAMSNIFERLGNYEEAYRVYKEYSNIKDSLFNEKNLKVIQGYKSELDKGEEKLYKQTKKNLALEKSNNQIIIYTAISIVIILIFIIIYIFIQFKNKKRIGDVLANQKEQILSQKKLVDEKNEEIYSSIRYAQKIQNTIIPTKSVLDKYLDDYFVFYKPKDIVSGDFYWFEELNGDIYIASVDCTGHGIPGSMLSIIGNKVLNDAINQRHLTQPDRILEHINTEFLYELNQKSGDSNSKDGMDICLIKINKGNNFIDFAGAKRPLIYTKNKDIFVVKGDKYSIGGNQKKTDINFTNHSLEIEKGMNLYLTTDGYVDQIGKNGKKFGSKKLRTLFSEYSDKSMNEQSFILDEEFTAHIGNEEQRDDITLIGIQF